MKSGLLWGGCVNAFYSHTKTTGDSGNPFCGSLGYDDGGHTVNNIQTGLLPSALGMGGKTRQNDLDIAFQFTFFVGANSGTQSAAGSNTLNIRQAYMTFGDKSWGSIKMGRDLGIFGSDAILSDMTLLGVGIGAGSNLESSTLGRIGSGYIYADWVGQISCSAIFPNKTQGSREWQIADCSGATRWEACFKKAESRCPKGFDTASREENMVTGLRRFEFSCHK